MQKPMISHIEDGDIQSWWTGKDMQKIRQQFIDGEWPDGCKICKQQEKGGVETIRDKWHRQFLFKLGANYDDIDVVYGNSTGQPFFIDYRPDNLCNLSCSMCNPGASSKIEQMAKDLDLKLWSMPKESSFKENDNIKNIMSPYTKRIKINGGEPTINDKIKDIYQYAIDKDYAKDMELKFTTNFTNFNKTFDMLDKFKIAVVTASLDGTGDTYEYIRTPAKWNVVKNNILKFKKMHDSNPKKYYFTINSVWFSATAFTLNKWLPELLNFLDNNFPKSIIIINQCQTPAFQNLSIIPTEYRQEIYETIECLRLEYPHWNYVFDELKFGLDWFEFNPENLKQWQETNPKMDAYKKINILDLHPRFKDLMNYNA